MKDYTVLRPYPPIVTILISLVIWGGGAVASETSQADAPIVETAAAHKTAPVAPPVAKGTMSPLLWGGIGLGVVTILVILYFLFGNMARKTTSEFETTIIDDIVSAIKAEYAVSEKDLCDLAVGVVATRQCSDPRLAGLMRIEYEVEKTSANRATRTIAVAIKKQNDIIVKKATRTMTWDDLPGTIRKEFILKNEKVLVYSLFSSNEKEG
jgi:hypothetical protein